MLKRVNKLPAGSRIKAKYGKDTVYLYAEGGKAIAYVDHEDRYRRFKGKIGRYTRLVAPTQVTSHCFTKAGFEINAGGRFFIPIAYRKATGRTTFRGMSLKQIQAAQKKY